MQSPPPVFWKIKPTAFGEGVSAILEGRGKFLMPMIKPHARSPPYIPIQGGGLGWGCLGKCRHLCSVQGPGWRLICLAVGWAAGFLDMGLTQIDHLDPLGQRPFPEQTQKGNLEKLQCDNWRQLHPGWVNTAWESEVVFLNSLRYWGPVGRCFLSWQPHPRSSFISHSTCLTLPGYVLLMFCTSHHRQYVSTPPQG